MLQRLCNGCGQPIDESRKFWTGQVSEVGGPSSPNAPMAMPTQFDFHEDHLPEELQALKVTAHDG
jgi:hypothetical protein